MPLEKIGDDAHVLGAVEGMAVSPRDVAHELRDWADELWPRLSPRLAPGERVQAQSLTILEIPNAEVRYSVGRREGSVSFRGRRMGVHSPDVDALRKRSFQLKVLGFGLATLLGAFFIFYFARSRFYATPSSGVMACSAVLCAASLVWLVARRSLGRPSKVPGAILGGLLLAAGVSAFLARPTASHASRLVATGDFAAAANEIEALGNPADAWNELLNARIAASMNVDQAQMLAEQLRPVSAISALARTRIFDLLRSDVERAVGLGDTAEAERLFGGFTVSESANPLVQRLRASILQRQAKHCADAQDSPCVDALVAKLQSEGFGPDAAASRAIHISSLAHKAGLNEKTAQVTADASRRVELLEDSVRLWSDWRRYSQTAIPGERERASALARARSEQKKQTAIAEALERTEARQRARQQAVEDAKARAEERRAQQREAARIRAEKRAEWSSSPLLCRDGALSPSCTCGGNHQGCCSHHGGIAGCSAER
ncbi:MAG: hypothetical protein H0T46_37570 [Deltaproteobacteria bacterium]|nr:hypothetical protein [Deltaproteobacteria bacterium]